MFGMNEVKKLEKVHSVLTKGENIEKSFKLSNCRAYATNKRLFKLEGNKVRDFDYNHISSVEYVPKRYWLLIILGFFFAATGYFVGINNDDNTIVVAGIAIGVLLILIGIFWKKETIVTDVIGVDDRVEYPGHRQELDSLLKIIREKQNATQSRDMKISNEQDFTDTLRKLAELRDEGIITQCEFEEKKSQILGNLNV